MIRTGRTTTTPEVVADPQKFDQIPSYRNVQAPGETKLFEPPKKDQKLVDFLVPEPQQMHALSRTLQKPQASQQGSPKRQIIPQFAQIVRNVTNYVKEAFPVVEKQILDSLTVEDQKDLALRAFANCTRFFLK